MAAAKISALPSAASAADDDLLAIVADPGGTPVSKKITKAALLAGLAAAWPIGSVFIAVVSTDPATLLGFGTWAAFAAGRVLVGLDAGDASFDTVEETGGAKTVAAAGANSAPTFTGNALGTHAHAAGTLVPSAHAGAAVADHAAHTHTFTQSANATTPDLLTVNTAAAGVAASGTTGNPNATQTHSVTQPNAHTMSGSSEAVSGGTPAGTVSAPTFTGSPTSVVQPYVTVYMWKRTA
jgi:hypothetical protein